jgi:MFS family permease
MSPPRTVSSGAPQWLALLSVCLAAAAMPLTFTGTAVALPAIGRELGGSAVALAWATNAFMLTFGSALMAAGAIADGRGRKAVFLSGVGAFALVSLALVASPDLLVFDLLRALQGLAAAAAFAGGMAALAQEFDGAARLRAFSLVGTSFGVGLALGPIASGLMIAAFGWRSIFLLVVAFASLSFLSGLFTIRETRDPNAASFDWIGAVSFTAMLSLFTYAVLLAPDLGWGSARVVGLLVVSAVCAALFVIAEKHVARPMLDLSLFRYRRFVGVQMLAAAPAYAFVVLLVLLPLRFVGIEQMSEIHAGMLMVALSSPLLVLPVIAGQMTRWFRPATICGLGLLVSAIGLAWLGATPSGMSAIRTALPMFLIGIGISLPWGLMDGLAVSVVPKERAGMATGIFSTVRVAGEGLALALVGAVLSALLQGRLAQTGVGGTMADAAHRLAVGDMASALAAVPGATAQSLAAVHADAFSTLLFGLSGVTLVTALAVTVFLGGDPERGRAAEASIRP